MATFKLTKAVDYKGRVTIPAEVLRASNIKASDTVYFEVSKNGSVIIRKHETKKVEENGGE